MKSCRSHIVWFPNNGSGRVRKIQINPSLIKVLSVLVILCICAVPLLEMALLSLNTKVHEMEQQRQDLYSEILTLRYLRRTLARIEKNEKALRGYFGIEKYTSLEHVFGSGGTPDMGLNGVEYRHLLAVDIPDDRRSTVPLTLPKKLKTLDSNYKVLKKLSEKKDEAWESVPNIVPLDMANPRISSGFGWRKNPFTKRREFHAGIDFIGPKGTRIIAPASGQVVNAGYDRWLGNYLVLQHTEGIKTIYGHLQKVNVDTGSRVRRGDLLGIMGNTGLSTSNHLHYSVIRNSQAVNPEEYILDMKS